MDFTKIYDKEYQKNDVFVARACRILFYFMICIWGLNIVGIFTVDKVTLNRVAVISILYLLAPTVILRIKISPWIRRYIIALCLLFEVTMLYSVLSFHVIFMFLFPVVIFSIYGNRKMLTFVIVGTIISMVISHVASFYLSVVPDEPFHTLRGILLFGLMPKLLIYLAFIYAFIYESIHNKKMLQRLTKYARGMHETQYELVRAFAEISESKSGQTGQHVKRVAEYVKAMAEYVGIEEEELDSLVTASMMHDVGKLMIPTEIIEKPGKLTDEEFAIVKLHTQYGYDLLKNSPGRTMEVAKVIALQHHERWDGFGYAKIAGENIDYYSRIVAIADVYDAINQ